MAANKNLNTGLIIGSNIVASFIVGLVLGLSLDRLFNSKPIMLLISLAFSFASCFLMIYREVYKK